MRDGDGSGGGRGGVRVLVGDGTKMGGARGGAKDGVRDRVRDDILLYGARGEARVGQDMMEMRNGARDWWGKRWGNRWDRAWGKAWSKRLVGNYRWDKAWDKGWNKRLVGQEMGQSMEQRTEQEKMSSCHQYSLPFFSLCPPVLQVLSAVGSTSISLWL